MVGTNLSRAAYREGPGSENITTATTTPPGEFTGAYHQEGSTIFTSDEQNDEKWEQDEAKGSKDLRLESGSPIGGVPATDEQFDEDWGYKKAESTEDPEIDLEYVTGLLSSNGIKTEALAKARAPHVPNTEQLYVGTLK